MAKIEKLIAIYTGAALNTPASDVIRIPSITGTVTSVYLDCPEASDGDSLWELFEDGVSITGITVADTTSNENVTGLSFSSTLGKVLSLSLLSPIPAGVPAPPWSLIVTVEITETHVALTGAQTVAGVKTFSSSPVVPTPSGSTDAANKAYVDSSVAGLSWKQAVRVATTANGTLATAFDNGETVDGVVIATGDRILIKDQSSGAENGIYIVAASGAPTRATDADSAAEILQASVYVQEGTTNADTQWVNTTNAPITLGSTALTFAQLSTGSGTVDTANSPNAGEWAKFTDADTIEGRTDAELIGDLSLEVGVDIQAHDDFLDDIAALTDPGADRGLFWDDSAGEIKFFEFGSGLTMTDTTLSAAGGSSVSGGSFDIDCGDATGAGDFVINCGDAT